MLLGLFLAGLPLRVGAEGRDGRASGGMAWLPRRIVLQSGGNIGLGAAGAGWRYWHGRAVSDLLYGYLPRRVGGIDVHTLSLKNHLHPFPLSLGKGRWWSPLYFGFSVNAALGNRYMLFLPDRFRDYYWPPGWRFTFFSGMELRLEHAPTASSWGVHVEIGSVDAYLARAFSNRTVLFSGVLGVAAGISWKLGEGER